MSQAAARPSGLVRVTVTSGTRRVDLVLPAAVPVAEVLPELARSVGLLDGATVHGGYRLVTGEGRELVPGAGLTVQGVEDGAVLTVTAGVAVEPPRVYDDVVEAMADVVERDLEPWQPAAGRRTALGAAALLLALGAVALVLQATTLAAVTAVLVSLGLVTAAIVLSRAHAEPEAAVAVAWTGCGYAAVAGLVLAPAGPLFGLPVALAGAGSLLAGLVCLLGLGTGRPLVLPPVFVGALLLVTGLVIRAAPSDAAVVLTSCLVLVVVLGSVLPWLALGATGTRVDQLVTTADITADPHDVDADQVAQDARIAHEILLATSVTVGVLLVLVAPVAVRLGFWGALIALMCCAIVMLRTRQYRVGSEVLTGLVSGIAGLGTVAGSALWWHPAWRPATAVALAALGAVLLALTLLPPTASVRRAWLGDVAETVALVTLSPLLVLATGAFEAVRS